MLGNLGQVHAMQGRQGEAQALFEAGLAIARELGDRGWQGSAHCNLGLLHQMNGDLPAATSNLQAALVLARRTLSAFVASALAIVGVIGTAGAAMFPFVMPSSSQPNASLTVWDSVSSHLTLGLMFWATLIFMPLIVFYTSWAYRVMRGKVTLAHIRANEHTAY